MNKQNKVLLGTLCAVILLMMIGYAAFSTVLKINGTATINSTWDVEITNIERTASKGATDVEGTPTYRDLSATFNTNFTTPGDYATYKIEITNKGSLDATLKNITMSNNTNNDIIFYLNKNQNNQDIAGTLKQNSTLFKKSETGNVGYVYVTVLYKDYENQQTATNKSQTITITFDFEQKTSSGIVVEPSEEITSDYTGILYSKNVLTGDDNTLNNYIHPGDSVENIKGYVKEDSSTLGNFFLKHIMTNGKVESSEVCFITDTEHCMKPNDFTNSKALIHSQQEWFLKVAEGGCGNCANFCSECNSSILSVGAYNEEGVNDYSDGDVRTYNDSAECLVRGNGSASCYSL